MAKVYFVREEISIEVPVGISGEDFRRRFFQKGEFPAGAAGENGAAGEAGDWGKKVGVGAAAGGCL